MAEGGTVQIDATQEGPVIRIFITGEPWENEDGEGLRIVFTSLDPAPLRHFWGHLGNLLERAEQAHGF